MRVYQRVDRPLVPVVAGRWSGAASRSTANGWRGSRLAVCGDHRRPRNGHPRKGRAVLHHRQPQAARRDPVRQVGLQGRQEGQDRAILYRPISRCWKASRRRGPKSPHWCWNGGSLSKLQIDVYRRAAGRDQPRYRPRTHQLQPSRRADRAACRPTIPTCRTSRSAPKSAARSAMPLWPSRATCCSRPTTARSNCALPRIWPMCPR